MSEREIPTAWVILFFAGLFETGWAIGLKYTEGFTRFWPNVWTVFAMVVSLWRLGIAMKTLPVGLPTAYGWVSGRLAPWRWELRFLKSLRMPRD